MCLLLFIKEMFITQLDYDVETCFKNQGKDF